MLPRVLPPGASISEWKGPDMVSVVDPEVESEVTKKTRRTKVSRLVFGAYQVALTQDTLADSQISCWEDTHQSNHTCDTSTFWQYQGSIRLQKWINFRREKNFEWPFQEITSQIFRKSFVHNTKHCKNWECCPRHSLFKGHNVIVNIVVLNCQKQNQ